ncbi:MAG TPA: hypothetical protein VNO50_04640 [Pyrinomonadaceae bacterium]|nr:hypothetical protein [Pyrinomonadaceae bacterium]
MRLANRALIAALATLMLCAVVSAQTLRLPEDPRNQSPAVGTGGPEGGPTGLFTIYDGSTIRKGEFTFSVAYSNFDRDPGNADIVETPLSFNVGLNDHVELFFKTNGYRGVKINNPSNLSSFYLPNTQLYFGASLLCSGGAVIIAPDRVSGTFGITGAQVRPPGPPCNVGGQPFVQFPFIGGTGPNFGLTGNIIAPPFVSRLGVPTGGGGSFSAASNFPGIGSPVGSILPGIVLSTRTIPPNLTFNTLTVPGTFTVAPSYLPDAPFISRLYGESAFGNLVFGAKIRFASPTHAVGYGIIPFYRWYLDNADDFSGFNQMQRGAGPGAQLGDFGLIGFFDARLSQHVNVSVNGGYILNSNPKSEPMNDATLLDRPDEALFGIGFDFPLNKYFQLIAEARATKYMGGRTPNAFNNNPVDVIGGVKIYPARWWGIGGAYRRHMNQQDAGRFGGTLPGGFRESEDPNGFIGQLWIGHRNPRSLPIPDNREPMVTVSASTASITTPCPPGTSSTSCTPSSSGTVNLTAEATDPDNDTLLYTWSVTGGTLSGDGRAVAWDLSGVNAGTYTATVTVNDGNNHTKTASTTVTVAPCIGCEPPCPTVSVSCPSDVDEGAPITITASAGDGSVTYNWSVSAGTITSGQGTSTITVDTANLGGQTVTATVEVGGLAPSCSRTASCSTQVRPGAVPPRKFDEYGDIRFNDEKARLDNYAIELQNAPGSTGTIFVFGNCAGAGQARGDRAKDYLVNTRGIDAARLTVVDGGCREELVVELWIVPTGATAPTPSNSATVDPCPECKRPAPRRRRGRRD